MIQTNIILTIKDGNLDHIQQINLSGAKWSGSLNFPAKI
jgi:hypothetical protein